jgi:hypothetical protein
MTIDILARLKRDEREAANLLLGVKPLTATGQQILADVLSIVTPKERVFVLVRHEAIRTLQSCHKTRGRPPWLAYVQRRYAEELVKLYGGLEADYWIGERRLQKNWQKLVYLTVRVMYLKGYYASA